MALRVKKINILNESLYNEIFEIADRTQAQLFHLVQAQPNKEVRSHKLESLTGFEPTFSATSSTTTLLTRKTLSPTVKSALKIESTEKKQLGWSTPEAGEWVH